MENENLDPDQLDSCPNSNTHLFMQFGKIYSSAINLIFHKMWKAHPASEIWGLNDICI